MIYTTSKQFTTALRTYHIDISDKSTDTKTILRVKIRHEAPRTKAGIKVLYNCYSYNAIQLDSWVEKKIKEITCLDEMKYKANEMKKRTKVQCKLLASKEIQVGTVLVNQRGREQSNVDCYQVIKKSGFKVWIRPISTVHVWDTGNSMAEDVQPKPMSLDHIINTEWDLNHKDVQCKMITSSWVNFDHWSCDIRNWKQKYYHSWYA